MGGGRHSDRIPSIAKSEKCSPRRGEGTLPILNITKSSSAPPGRFTSARFFPRAPPAATFRGSAGADLQLNRPEEFFWETDARL